MTLLKTVKNFTIYSLLILYVFISFSFASEMTDLINVTKYHKLGFKGQGVKYIVLDGDFSGWCNLRAQGVNIQSDGNVSDSDTGGGAWHFYGCSFLRNST
jgi:hypothetical protein